MKQIHFLENDYQCTGTEEDLRIVKRHLHRMGFSKEEIGEMTIHYQFRSMNKEDIYKIVFDKKNILATYSSYIRGSDTDFMFFTASAGRNEVKDVVYIDTCGTLADFLNDKLRESIEDLRAIIVGINSNIVLTYNPDSPTYTSRIKINISDMYNNCIVKEDYQITQQ